MCPSENICFRAFITRKMAEILSMGHMNLARLLIWFHNDRRVLFGIRACPRCCRRSLGLRYSEEPFSCSSSFSQVLDCGIDVPAPRYHDYARCSHGAIPLWSRLLIVLFDLPSARKGGRMQKTCCLVNGWHMTFLNPSLYGIGLVARCWRRCQSLAFMGAWVCCA